MLEVLLPFGIFLGSLIVLLKSADFFVDAAEDLGHKLHWPHFVVGVLIVGLGTSLPELASSLAAQWRGTTEIIVANIVGSNIANICLAFAMGSYFGVVKNRHEPKVVDLAFLGGVTTVFLLLASQRSMSMIDGFILLTLLVIFLLMTLQNSAKDHQSSTPSVDSYWQIGGILIVSGAAVIIAADWTIKGLLGVSAMIGISEAVASMVLLAIGTSLPEVFVSIAAMRKGNGQLALGNVMGSNVINIVLIGGLPAVIGTVLVSQQTITIGLPFMAIATLIFMSCGYLKHPRAHAIEATVLLGVFGLFLWMLLLQ